MQNSWEATIASILEWEGADVNVSPGEPGGISKYGVSLQTYAEFCVKNQLPTPTADTIKNLTAYQASFFYKQYFAVEIDFDNLPVGVDYRLMDIITNLGIGGAHRLVAAVTNRWVPIDRTNIAEGLSLDDPVKIIGDLSVGWISIKSASPNWSLYGRGWSNRNIAQRKAALAMVQHVG